jgi:hypothetical protein
MAASENGLHIRKLAGSFSLVEFPTLPLPPENNSRKI